MIFDYQDYFEKFKGIKANEIGNAIVIAIITAAVFALAFPERSLYALSYDIFMLPKPGSEIALLVGPVAILSAYIAYSINPRPGIILFNLGTYAIAMPAFQLGLNPEGLGAYPYFLNLLAILVLMVFLEVLVYFFSKWETVQSMALPALISNLALLLFYWILVFPFQDDVWPVKSAVSPDGVATMIEYLSPIPIILGVAMVGAIVIGALIPILLKLLVFKKKRASGSV